MQNHFGFSTLERKKKINQTETQKNVLNLHECKIFHRILHMLLLALHPWDSLTIKSVKFNDVDLWENDFLFSKITKFHLQPTLNSIYIFEFELGYFLSWPWYTMVIEQFSYILKIMLNPLTFRKDSTIYWLERKGMFPFFENKLSLFSSLWKEIDSTCPSTPTILATTKRSIKKSWKG